VCGRRLGIKVSRSANAAHCSFTDGPLAVSAVACFQESLRVDVVEPIAARRAQHKVARRMLHELMKARSDQTIRERSMGGLRKRGASLVGEGEEEGAPTAAEAGADGGVRARARSSSGSSSSSSPTKRRSGLLSKVRAAKLRKKPSSASARSVHLEDLQRVSTQALRMIAELEASSRRLLEDLHGTRASAVYGPWLALRAAQHAYLRDVAAALEAVAGEGAELLRPRKASRHENIADLPDAVALDGEGGDGDGGSGSDENFATL
jgi:hypothetical protein